MKDILFRCAVIVAAKGGMLADIAVGDVLEILDAEYAVRGRTDSASATYSDAAGSRGSRRGHAYVAADPQYSANVRSPNSSIATGSRVDPSGTGATINLADAVRWNARTELGIDNPRSGDAGSSI